jgi:hypothetical protein
MTPEQVGQYLAEFIKARASHVILRLGDGTGFETTLMPADAGFADKFEDAQPGGWKGSLDAVPYEGLAERSVE